MIATSALFSAKHTPRSTKNEVLKPQEECTEFNHTACIEVTGSAELISLQRKQQRWWKRWLKKNQRLLVK